MKISALITVGVATVALAGGIAFRARLRYLPIVGPTAPTAKWQFATTESIVQDCTKPGSPFYAISRHKCDPTIPDHLPEHTPAIDTDGTIYVGGAKGLYALNAEGTEKWFYELEENGFNFQVKHLPVLYAFIDDSGKIWFDFKSSYQTGTAGLYRVDAGGEGKALVSGVHTVTQTGLLKDGTIFVTWDQTPPAFFSTDGVQQPNAGYIPTAEIRQQWWDAEFGVPRDCWPPAFGTDGTRYVGCNGQFLVLKPDGTKKWFIPTPGHWASQPAIAEDGTIYFGSEDGALYAVSSDGKVKWKFETRAAVHSTPAIARNGTVFFGSDDHYLYAVSTQGKAKWQFETGGPVYSPTVGADGTVYALSADGKLYAIQDREQNGGLWGQWPKLAGGIRNDWRGSATR